MILSSPTQKKHLTLPTSSQKKIHPMTTQHQQLIQRSFLPGSHLELQHFPSLKRWPSMQSIRTLKTKGVIGPTL